MSSVFRRMLSPRDRRESKGSRDKDAPRNLERRAFSASAIQQGSASSNGHHLTSSTEVENMAYHDPTVVNDRQQQQQQTATTEVEHPPLPPRNARPASVGNLRILDRSKPPDEDEEERFIYVAPADTIRRPLDSPGLKSSQSESDVGGPVPTRNERKQMHMHELVMSQKRTQSDQLRMRSVPDHTTGNDDSEYSTPFNLVKAERERRERERENDLLPDGSEQQQQQPLNFQQGVFYTDPPPIKPPRTTKPGSSSSSQTLEKERVMSILSPPPISEEDSGTNSPCSPYSIPEVESGERSLADVGGGDYDEPWDQKFKDLHMPRFKRQPSDRMIKPPDGDLTLSNEDCPPIPKRFPSQCSSISSAEPPVARPVIIQTERGSSPPIDNTRALTGRTMSDRVRRSTPPLPPEPQNELSSRARMSNTRASSDRLRDPPQLHQHHQLPPPDVRSTSPNLTTQWGSRVRDPYPSRSFSHSQVHNIAMIDDELAVRSNSVSHMSGRRLPSPPRVAPPPEPQEPYFNRGTSPPTFVRIDTSIPLVDQPWYHGSITRADAEAILLDQLDFSFLVRNSESCRTDYSLSIRDSSCGYIHLRVVYENGGYVLGQFSSLFGNVEECIAFYTRQRLNIRGAEHKKLQYPVPRSPARAGSIRDRY